MTSTILPPYKSCPLPGGTLAYREAGLGQTVVLIHGVGMQSAAWAPQIATLARSYRVIALDMPGHGGSSPLSAQAQLADFVVWLGGALDALELGAVSLIGHSMGALIAAGYAVTHPERVERVALLNGVFRRSPTARAAVLSRAETIRSGAFDLETPLERWFGSTPAEIQARSQVSGWLTEVNIDGYATAYTAFARGDQTYADQIKQIQCPLLALTGDGDLNSTPAMAQAMAAETPDGHAVIIEGHRHMVNLTAPEAVNAALAIWLTSSTKEQYHA
ncbi:alpha/beta fold hydrolase [Aliiroseovarius crassostreae]|uniref:alpha/beta fold hydrolase n=1 Tax=Aliiroseovarius crassostreae TaxID=154981 RepID=UPI0021FA6734|nr:alpha/beta fold hydrolase [Aliiroseovarius crassostreae]UWP88226.1 alpha/beta fold hydrolase [Aliiroseovarius crassostreae]